MAMNKAILVLRWVVIAAVLCMHSLVFAASGSATYTYDDLGRLVQIDYSDGTSIVYTYDAAGNRLSETITGNFATDFSIAGPAQPADEGGDLVFTVTRSGNVSQAQSIDFATVAATGAAFPATAGVDYTSNSGTLNFAVDETSKPVTVSTLDDFDVENGETVRVALSNEPAGTTVSTREADGTIADNDVASSLSIANASGDEGTDITFTVTRAGDTSIAQSVSYATSDGTATAGSDYTSASGTLDFGVGETSKPIPVAALSDAFAESDETFTVTLSNPTNGASITTGTATGTIVNVGGSDPFALAVNNPQAVSDSNTLDSFTISEGPNRMLVVCAVVEGSSGDVLGATFAGRSLTLAAKRITTSSKDVAAAIYYMLDVDIGAGAHTSNISVTFHNTSNLSRRIMAFYLTNTAQAAPEATATVSSSTSATSIQGDITTTASDAVVTTCLGGGSMTSGWTPDPGETLLSYAPTSGMSGGASYEIFATAGQKTMGWSGSSLSNQRTLVMASFAEAPGAGTPPAALISVNNPQSINNTTTLSNYTLAAGNDRILVVCGAVVGQDAEISGATFAGKSLTLAVKEEHGGGLSRSVAGIYYLLESDIGASGQSGDIVVSFSYTSAVPGADKINAFYLTNASQTGVPDATAIAADPGTSVSSIQGNISTVSADVLVTTCVNVKHSDPWRPDTVETQISYESSGGAGSGASYRVFSTAGPKTMQWSGAFNATPVSLAIAAFTETPPGM